MTTKRGIKAYGFLVLKGMGMGAADVVPGVSGGTIAFIVGIYEELINSIKNINNSRNFIHDVSPPIVCIINMFLLTL